MPDDWAGRLFPNPAPPVNPAWSAAFPQPAVFPRSINPFPGLRKYYGASRQSAIGCADYRAGGCWPG